MISWFTDIVALAMNTVYQGDARALVALFFVSALTEVGMPFPFVIDGVLVVTSYETGLWSLPVARIVIALLLGRQFGSAVIYWLSRFLGSRFITWLGKRFPKLLTKMAWLNTRLSRRAPLAVAIVRLTPGLLTSSSVAAGCIRMRYHHLVLGIILASVIADGALVIIGVFTKYGLSILGFTPSTWEGIGALAVVILLVGFVRWLWLRRHAHKNVLSPNRHTSQDGQGSSSNKQKGGNVGILLIIGIILLILWLLGLFVFSLGALVHLALVIAVILIIIWLLKAVFRLF